MKRWILTALCLLVILAVLDVASGQRWWRRSDPRNGVPTWDLHPTMPRDVFTFVRVRYTSAGRGWGAGWDTDHPDAELNLAHRLHEMTSISTYPNDLPLELTDPRLTEYPFIYMVEPGSLYLYENEAVALRNYLLNGGFLMVDDFWGDYEWGNFHDEFIGKVFPDRQLVDLSPDHPIFNIIFPIPDQRQIPNIRRGWESQFDGVTWEYERGPGTKEPHYRGLFDDNGRLMAVICHNTDLGDGWEREGENEYYFREFSEKIAYPLGINILFYAMTH